MYGTDFMNQPDDHAARSMLLLALNGLDMHATSIIPGQDSETTLKYIMETLKNRSSCADPILSLLTSAENRADLISCRGLRWMEQDDPAEVKAMPASIREQRCKLIHQTGLVGVGIHPTLCSASVGLSNLWHLIADRHGKVQMITDRLFSAPQPYGSLNVLWVAFLLIC